MAQKVDSRPPAKAVADDQPMKIVRVRSANPACQPNCPEWIAAQGRIDATSLPRLRKVLAQLGSRKVPILINSAGGSVDPSLEMGRLIRAKGLDVVVTKTVFMPRPPCASGDRACREDVAKGIVLGRPEARLSACASACVHVLAGGVNRYVGPWTVVGVHQILSQQTYTKYRHLYRVHTRYQYGVPVSTQKKLIATETLSQKTVTGPAKAEVYDKIRRFLTEMGVATSLVDLMRATPHVSVHILKLDELRSSKIATAFINGEMLIGAVPPPPAPPQPPPTVTPVAAPPVEGAAAPLPAELPAKPSADTKVETQGEPKPEAKTGSKAEQP
jgi:hypothetical protein